MRLTLPQLARFVVAGTKTVVQLVLEGELNAGRGWVAAKGAARYLEAIARDEIAETETVEARAAQCRSCPARREPGPDDLSALGWCGDPLVEHLDGPVSGRTCGCLLDGKIMVEGEACPRGWWAALFRKHQV